jgi:hypothetical protein
MTPARRFAYRLALALEQPNPEAMLARMPWRVFVGWMQYAQAEPFGEERADVRAAIVATTVANCLAREKGKPPFKLADFMPRFGQPGKRKTADDLFKQVKWLNMLMGGEFVDKRKSKDGD